MRFEIQNHSQPDYEKLAQHILPLAEGTRVEERYCKVPTFAVVVGRRLRFAPAGLIYEYIVRYETDGSEGVVALNYLDLAPPAVSATPSPGLDPDVRELVNSDAAPVG